MGAFHYKKLFVLLLIFIVIFVSSCAPKQTSPQPAVCGNSIIEAGEECDNSDCPSGKICSAKCKCKSLGIPAPPQIPE